MEIWIRSQDKTTLIRSYEIYIAEYGKDSYVIRAKRTSHILGAYNSFERALKVLDEIQAILKIKMQLQLDKEAAFQGLPDNVEGIKVVLNQLAVYEMPKN